MIVDLRTTAVSELRGVGKVRAAAYEKLGVRTVGDLLYHLPRAYENRGAVRLLSQAVTDGQTRCPFLLTVATTPRVARIRQGLSLLKFRAFDESGTCEITYFNQDYLRTTFLVGSVFRFYGKVEAQGNRYTMASPAWEPYAEGVPLPPFVSVYPLCEGLTQKQVKQNISEALTLLPTLEDPLPAGIRSGVGLCTRAFALRQIHCPEDYEALAAAKKRLVFDELFLFALGLEAAKANSGGKPAVACAQKDPERFTALLPYRLTGAQERAIRQIFADMGKNTAMNRIVVGDVGCGKTVCAAAAIFLAASSGMQAALMVPTEILARQHFADLSSLLGELGISCGLLTGTVRSAEKRKIYAGLADGSLQVVIGTQALLSAGVSFAHLGLVVADEQHRFGVGQRAALLSAGADGNAPHLLLMSATPIPRSLALVLYGDLQVSRIDEMPPGRQRVDTFVVDERYRARLDGFIRKNLAQGGQVYIVCPAVEERDGDGETDGRDDGALSMEEIGLPEDERRERETMPPLKAAVQYAEQLQQRLPEVPIAFVHGKMKAADKEAIMRRFSTGEVRVLVSTTVIEVGVNVPDATLMMVENAERFGLSQLHQLRGRVGRGRKKSYCVLVAGAPADGQPDAEGHSIGQKARERLEVMRTTYDGYEIAQRDLQQRGPGDFIAGCTGQGIRQSGTAGFRIADMGEDAELLYTAFDEAKKLFAEDPTLSGCPALLREVQEVLTANGNIMN